MKEKLVCTKLNNNDILPAKKGDVFYIDDNTFPVTGYINTDVVQIPLADIPVMSDKKWRELSNKSKSLSSTIK